MTREEIQEEALKATEGRRRCSVVLGTGVGKTLVGLLHIEKNTSELHNVLVSSNLGLMMLLNLVNKIC